MNEKTAIAYNELFILATKLALNFHQFRAQEGVVRVCHPDTFVKKTVNTGIVAAINRQQHEAIRLELIESAKESRLAKVTSQPVTIEQLHKPLEGSDFKALQLAQPEIRMIIEESDKRRQADYDRYRQLIIQGVALPPSE